MPKRTEAKRNRNNHVHSAEVSRSSDLYKKRHYRWVVTTHLNGKRIARKFFKQGEADTRNSYIAEQEAIIDNQAAADVAQAVNPQLQRELAEALKILKPWNASLKEAAQFYARSRQERSAQESTTIEEVIPLYLNTLKQRELDPKTINRARQTLQRFQTSFPARTLSSLQGHEIQLWWEGFGGLVNQRANRTDVNTFLNWCVGSPRLPSFSTNPTPAAPKLPTRRKKRTILTSSEVETLLNSASEEILPVIVVQVFLGVRIEESLRLRWEYFDWEENTLFIPDEIAKGGANHQRIIEITGNARRWLDRYRLKIEGSVLPSIQSRDGFTKALAAIRKKAGWDASNPWPRNALRRTFISAHYATYEQVGKTAAIAGTSESVVFRNYRTLVKKATAQKLWQIYPAGSQ